MRDIKRVIKKLVEEDILHLLEMSKRRYHEGSPDLAKRYVYLAHKLKLKYKVKLKKNTVLKYCKRCWLPWIPGETVQVRIAGKKSCVEYRCVCGNIRRKCY